MILEKDNTKIKYLIGTYKENSDYPTIEDIKYIILNYCNINNTNLILETKIESLLKKSDIINIIIELKNNNFLILDNVKTKKYKVINK